MINPSDNPLRPPLSTKHNVPLSEDEQLDILHDLDRFRLGIVKVLPRVRIAGQGSEVVIESHGSVYLERYETPRAAQQRVTTLLKEADRGAFTYPTEAELAADLLNQLARILDMPRDMLCDAPTDSAAAVFYGEAIDAAMARRMPTGGDGAFSEHVDLSDISIWREEGGDFFAALPGAGPNEPSLGPFGCGYDAAQGCRRALLARKYAAEADAAVGG